MSPTKLFVVETSRDNGKTWYPSTRVEAGSITIARDTLEHTRKTGVEIFHLSVSGVSSCCCGDREMTVEHLVAMVILFVIFYAGYRVGYERGETNAGALRIMLERAEHRAYCAEAENERIMMHESREPDICAVCRNTIDRMEIGENEIRDTR